MSSPQLTNFKNGKSADDFLWNLRMTGQLGSTLLKSKVPENWKAGPNNKGPNVPSAGKRERQQAIVNRLQKEFNELVSQSSRTMNQEKRLQNLMGSLYAERDILRSMGGSRKRRGGYTSPPDTISYKQIKDDIMNKYGCNTQFECSQLLYNMINDPNLTESQRQEASQDYSSFMNAIYSSISTLGGRRKAKKTKRNRNKRKN